MILNCKIIEKPYKTIAYNSSAGYSSYIPYSRCETYEYYNNVTGQCNVARQWMPIFK